MNIRASLATFAVFATLAFACSSPDEPQGAPLDAEVVAPAVEETAVAGCPSGTRLCCDVCIPLSNKCLHGLCPSVHAPDADDAANAE